MGTNFYYIEEVKFNSFILLNQIHIGKSSFGWCFGLRTCEENQLLTWDDWKMFLQHKQIVDEYNNPWSLHDFIKKVEDRPQDSKRHSKIGYCRRWGIGPWDMMDDIYFR